MGWFGQTLVVVGISATMCHSAEKIPAKEGCQSNSLWGSTFSKTIGVIFLFIKNESWFFFYSVYSSSFFFCAKGLTSLKGRYICFGLLLKSTIFSSDIFESLIKSEFQILLRYYICQGDTDKVHKDIDLFWYFQKWNQRKFLCFETGNLGSPIVFTFIVHQRQIVICFERTALFILFVSWNFGLALH